MNLKEKKGVLHSEACPYKCWLKWPPSYRQTKGKIAKIKLKPKLQWQKNTTATTVAEVFWNVIKSNWSTLNEANDNSQKKILMNERKRRE